jgi:hypothetical protein
MLIESARADGWVSSPHDLLAQLREIDPWALQDALQQVGWELISGADTTNERALSMKASRSLYKYSPLAQWAIWLWSAWGLGDGISLFVIDKKEGETELAELAEQEKGELKLGDPNAIVQEFWTAERNAATLGDDIINEMSDWLLVDGNTFLVFYASTQDGETTVSELSVDEVSEIVTHPEDKRKALFYKRVFNDANSQSQTWYYPDWQAYFSGELDKPYLGDQSPDQSGNRLTLAQTVLPDGAYRADTQTKSDKARRPQSETLGAQVGENQLTSVCVLHVAHNRKECGSLWGWPLSTCARQATQAHKQFVESRLTVARAKAMYVRRIQADTGSRGIKAIKALRGSALSATSYLDTNPPGASGGEDIINKAMEVDDLSMGTGAGDASTDNEVFTWWALLGYGLFPTSAGLDTSRWATAVEMDKAQGMLFTRYQTFWAKTLRDMCKIVLRFRERYGRQKYGEYEVEVSIDSLSLADFSGVSKAIGVLIADGLNPLVDSGIVKVGSARAIVAQLWRICLQALGVKSAGNLTSDEAFGIGEGEPEREEKATAPPPPPAVMTVSQPEQEASTQSVAEMILQNARGGSADWRAVAEYMACELAEAR